MGIKSRVDGQEMLVLLVAVEGPDLSGQTADRKQTRASQVRGIGVSEEE